MGRCLLVTSVVLILGGSLLAVTAVATPFWALSQNSTAGAVYSCQISSSFSLSQCQLYTAPSATDIVLLVTSLAIISGLCFVVAAILGLVLLCQPTRCLRIAAVVFALVADGLMVSVLVIFGVRLSRFAADADVSSLHFSYWLAALGSGLALLGTVLLMCVRLPHKVTPSSSTTFTRMSRSEERERAEALFVKIYSDFLKKHPTSLAAVSEGQQEAAQEGAKNPPAVLNEDRPPKPQAHSPPPVHQARSRVVLDNSQAQMVSRARSVVTEPIRQPQQQRLNSHGPVVNPQAMELAARRYSHPQHSHMQMTQQPHQQRSADQQQRQLQETAEYHSLYQHHQQLREMEYHHHNHYHQHLHQEHPHHHHQHQQQATQLASQTEQRARGGGEVMRRGAWETVPRSMPGYPGVAAPGSVLPGTPATRGRGRGSPVPQSRPFVPRLQLPGSLSDDGDEQSKKVNYGYQRF